MQFSNFREKIFNKNTLFSIYFIFFIILNILDFLGKLSEDLDFFKKLLSWTLIGVLFYQISLTKIFIGKKLGKYDLAYIFAFFILLIPKILSHYIKGVSESSFVIFNSTISALTFILNNYLDFLGSVFLGMILLLLINFILLSNHKIESKSFIGSLNLQSTFGHRITTHISLFFLVFFFAFVVAPFFLEWFALSVDALILVVGLIYYIIVFIHKYREGGKISNFLKVVYNSGNSFFKNLISTFSNKKTFFIGVSFLLAVHLLVDIGIYMVPYLVGTSSPLYFEALDVEQSLGVEGREHIPIFNFFDITYSQSYNEISTIFSSENSSNIFLKIVQFIFVLLLYVASYIYFFILLFFPFYYIYKRIKNQIIVLPKYIIIFIIAMSLFYILSQDFFMSTISMPISIGTTQSIGVEGVDIHTSPIFDNNISLSAVDFSDTISLLIFFILLFFLFVIIKFEKYKKIFTYITYSIFLLFFVIYIMLFYIDLNTGIFNKQEISRDLNYLHAYTNENKSKQSTYETSRVELLNDLIITGEIYTTSDEKTFFYGTYELNSITYDILKENTNVGFANKQNYLYIQMKYSSEILERKIRDDNLLQSYISGKKEGESENIQSQFLGFISYIAFFFSSVFYVIGIIVFSIHYIKTLYRRELR